jgi:phosphoribosylformylglycinamidine cyclo-ligase
VRPMKQLLADGKLGIKAAAHITGGGWRNLFRLNDNVGFVIDNPLPEPGVFALMEGQVAETELFTTFNMGMGFAVIAPPESADAISEAFIKSGMAAQKVGTVTAEKGIMKVTRKGAWDSINILTISNELKK